MTAPVPRPKIAETVIDASASLRDATVGNCCEILAGSTLEFEGFAKEVTAAGLKHILSLALELLPGLASLPVVESWAGLRPFTEDQLPVLGPGPLPGLFLASGHFRNGILLAPVTAELLAQAVLARTPSLSLEPFRWNRPGIT